MTRSPAACLFCEIVAEKQPAARVFEDEHVVAFLDHRPVFFGHTLIVPRVHHATLADLPTELLAPLFSVAQRMSRAVEVALEAGGSFVAMNNRISQSVPHLHVHVVPRRRGDGLRGFFWPRTRYASNEEMLETAARIATACKNL